MVSEFPYSCSCRRRRKLPARDIKMNDPLRGSVTISGGLMALCIVAILLDGPAKAFDTRKRFSKIFSMDY